MRKTAFLMLVAGFGGTLFDFGGSIIAPAIPYLEAVGTFSAEQISRLTSAAVLSAAVSCFLTGFVADRFGRKPTMLLVGIVALVATFPICLSDLVPGHAFALFYIGRFLQGLAAGAVGVVVPMYLVEALAADMRGKGATVFQLLDLIGVFCCSLVGIAVVHVFGPADGATVSVAAKTLAWKTIFASNLIPSLLFFLGVLFLPESPVWLNRTQAAAQGGGGEWTGSLFQRKYVLPFLLACVVLMCNQGAAVTSLQYYTVKLLQDAGLSNTLANQMNGVVMAVLAVATAVALPFVDRCGRRPLMIVGTAGVVLGHLAAAFLYLGLSHGHLASGPLAGYCAAVALSCVCFFFGIGPGVVAWLVLSEMMPDRIRARGMSIAMLFNMIVAYLIADQLLLVGARYGYAPMFFLFAASSVVYFLTAVFFLPETKGKTLAEIEQLWA